jgi:hypothetical protein
MTKLIKYLHSFFFLYCFSNVGFGQSLSNIDYNSGGGEVQIDRIVYSYTIGGMAATTIENDEAIVTQGYQQIDSIILQAINIDPKIGLSAFPNPAKDKVFIMFSDLEKPVNCLIEELSSNGKSSFMNKEYYFENEVPVEVDIRKSKDAILWLKIYEKSNRKLLGMIKIVVLK